MISDEHMHAELARSRDYTVVSLITTPKRDEPGGDEIVWAHGRRNMELRASGVMPVILRMVGEGGWAGLCVLSVPPAEARKIMEEDPGVRAGIFTYEVRAARGFPGDRLP